MEHTPAPWKVKDNRPSWKITAKGFTIATIIATSKAEPETKEANAHLIAAAPELLEALINLLLRHGREHLAQDCPECAAARSAIAKAEGK